MPIIQITNFHAPELDLYARKTEVQLLNREHPEQGIFIAESPRVIERALHAGCIPISFLVETRHLSNTQSSSILSQYSHLPIYTAEFDILTQLTGFPLTCGMLCAMHRPPLPTIAQVCADARRVAVLENVMNPTNVGAIFRSAAALNMDAVLLTPQCSNPLYRRCIRVSMGTVFQIPWTFLGHAHTRDAHKELAELRTLGFRIVSMALCDHAMELQDPRLAAEERLAIVLGTEGDGLASHTILESDYTVRIPMYHGVDSLNVAAASAVAFWQLAALG